jgi:hypothetical protein
MLPRPNLFQTALPSRRGGYRERATPRLDVMLRLAGTPVDNESALELAALLDVAGHEDVADAIATALEQQRFLMPLTVYDRGAILSVLDDPPEGLAELRGVLLREHEWRRREGL